MKRFSSFFNKATMLLLGAIFAYTSANSQNFTISPLPDYSGTANSKSNHAHNEKCAHGVLEEMLVKEMGYFGTKDFFENWIDSKIEAQRNQPLSIARTQEEIRLIPVVVHVIHNGTPIGQGANVPLSQIESQIRTLNEDFRRLNPDANRTPAEFLPVAADSKIEFVLAKQDPNGLPTNGIVRIQGPKTSYAPQDAAQIGQLSQWNPDEYLNIWVVPLNQPFIGYASFPVSGLPGLNFSPAPAITDGVTIDFRFFGTGGNAIGASLGRTATHEVGHYFGLRHIWGDGGCGVDDFVSDTPEQDNSNSTCNDNPSRFSCGSNDMIQNYMDYTPDACMNIFTRGQVERFNAVLANSPRRRTLVNNRATQEPVLVDRDLAISRIVEPGNFACSPIISPSIQVKNAGKQTISSARIELRRNGAVVESRRFSLNLVTGADATLSFNNFNISADGNEIEFRVVQVNDNSDENSANNSLTSSPVLQQAATLPLSLNLASIPNSWSISNPDGSFTWEPTRLTISGTQQDLIYIRHYFISPVIDLSANPNAQLVFELAHAPYNQPGFQDDLIVAVSTDCGNTFQIADATYDKSGVSLETSNPTLNEFIPTQNSQFRTELVNLSPFAELGQVRIAFISVNSYGNNIYLKNIRILQEKQFKYELTLEELILPTPISDGRYEDEVIRVKNTGNLPVSRFVFTKSTNGSSTQGFLASGSAVAPGESFNLTGGNSTQEGVNRLNYGVIFPNFDQNSGNEDELERFIIEDSQNTLVPWRQNFNFSTSIEPWRTINPEENRDSWTTITTNNTSNNVNGLQNPQPGNSYWLGSPIFNLSNRTQASVFFDYAVGEMAPSTRLTLFASSDAGETYIPVWEAMGENLRTTSANVASPSNASDFRREFVNLTEFTGNGNQAVRLAFALDAGEGFNSPIYLDNIELFLTANPQPVIPTEGMSILYPNPASDYFNIAFNLPRYENVTIQIISASGQVLQQVVYPNTLNQTYSFSREIFPPGFYIVRINSNTISETKKLIIN
jgi:hypothetical protein